METLCLQEQEMLTEKMEGIAVLYDKRLRGFKEKILFKTPGRKEPKV